MIGLVLFVTALLVTIEWDYRFLIKVYSNND
jgi:hypothetical protein